MALLLSSSGLWAQTADEANVELPLAPPPPPPEPSPEDASPPVASPSTVASPAKSSPAKSSPAKSSPAKSSPAEPSLAEPERDWYGWQLMINDFVALGTLGGAALAGLKGDGAIAVIVPVALVYDLGGPTIHWLHARKKIAAASLGVRIGVPFVGVLVGAAVAGCAAGRSTDANACRSRGAGYGALFGFAAATAFDAALLAWDAPRGPPRSVAAFRMAPWVIPHDGGAELGVVGMF